MKSEQPKVDLEQGIATSKDVHYMTPRDQKPPMGVKLNILGRGGVQVTSEWKSGVGFIAWAPLLKVQPHIKAVKVAAYKQQELLDWDRYVLPNVPSPSPMQKKDALLTIVKRAVAANPGLREIWVVNADDILGAVSKAGSRGVNREVDLRSILSAGLGEEFSIKAESMNFRSVSRELAELSSATGGLDLPDRLLVDLSILTSAESAQRMASLNKSTDSLYYVHHRSESEFGLERVWIGPGPAPDNYFAAAAVTE